MRALIRMRTLAAACALLLFVSGTAMAGWASKPMDRPGTPDPPPMVGDPDDPQGLPMAVFAPWGYMTLRVPISVLPYLRLPARTPPTRTVAIRKPSSRGAHAR